MQEAFYTVQYRRPFSFWTDYANGQKIKYLEDAIRVAQSVQQEQGDWLTRVLDQNQKLCWWSLGPFAEDPLVDATSLVQHVQKLKKEFTKKHNKQPQVIILSPRLYALLLEDALQLASDPVTPPSKVLDLEVRLCRSTRVPEIELL